MFICVCVCVSVYQIVIQFEPQRINHWREKWSATATINWQMNYNVFFFLFSKIRIKLYRVTLFRPFSYFSRSHLQYRLAHYAIKCKQKRVTDPHSGHYIISIQKSQNILRIKMKNQSETKRRKTNQSTMGNWIWLACSR